MWPAGIAATLRERGHHAEAVTERADLRGRDDETIFAVAQEEGRVIVTENVVDFRPLARERLHRGEGYCGLVFTTNKRFPRHDPRTVGRLVTALDRLLASDLSFDSVEYWLTS